MIESDKFKIKTIYFANSIYVSHSTKIIRKHEIGSFMIKFDKIFRN